MKDFNDLIISAFRDPNFKLAAAADDMDADATAEASLIDRFNAAISARKDIKLEYQIRKMFHDAKSFIESKTGQTPPNALTIRDGKYFLTTIPDPKIKQFYETILVRIVDNLEKTSSAASIVPTSPATSTTETSSSSSAPEIQTPKETSLKIEINTADHKVYELFNDVQIGYYPDSGGIKIDDIGAGAIRIYIFPKNGTWKMMPIEQKGTFLNGKQVEAKEITLNKGDFIFFSKTRIKILDMIEKNEGSGTWDPMNTPEPGGFFGDSIDISSDTSSGGYGGFGGRRIW